LTTIIKYANINYMRKLILPTVVFVGTPVMMIVSVVFLFFLVFQENQSDFLSLGKDSYQKVSYAALPTNQNVFNDEVVSKDARIDNVRKFFVKYNSPLEPFTENVISAADTYGLDFRLIPAIAMQESNLCLKIIPNSYNCWGFGIYGKQVKKFNNYAEAIDTVTRSLARDYKGIGLETPEQIMKKYTPSNNGDWAKSVNHFMDVLKITP